MAGNSAWLPVTGKLPEHWDVVPFGDVLDGGTRNGIYKPKQFHGSGAKIVNMGELFAHPRLFDVPMRRLELTETEVEKSSLQPGDLLFARRSLVAEGAGKCIVVCDVQETTTFESSIIRARPKPRAADSLYLYYLFNSPFGRYSLDTIRRQVAVSGITGSDLVTLRIPLPPLPEQKAIAHILGTLDDKIELNRRMNETLEGMARAIFKSWFVDFDPVRAKMDGRPTPGLDPATAKLFPDGFKESELGHIPRGWATGSIGDVGENPRRGIKPDSIPEGTAYIALEHMPRRSITLPDWNSADKIGSGKCEFNRGEILFGKLRPYFHKVGVPAIDGVCSTDILVITPKASTWFGFLLGHMSSDELVSYTDMTSTGTKMPRTNWKDIARFEIVLPPASIAKSFDAQARTSVGQIHANIYESRTLATLRNTLLPKLLSGEIRVGDAERIVEEVI